MSDFSTAQIMLTLSLLATRGFWNSKKKNHNHLAQAVSAGLDQLEPLKGDWQLVWGPGTYRYLGSAFDSSMMFVVQHKRQPSRFAIVVRGTNPIDVYDWLLGDFLPHRQVPWHTSDKDIAPGAELSMSTALGLKILLNISAESDPGQITEEGEFDYLLERGATAAVTVAQAGGASLAKTDDLLTSSPAAASYDKVRKLVKKLLKYQKLWSLIELAAGTMASKVGDVLKMEDVVKILKLRKRLIKMLDKTMEPFAEAPVAMLMPSLEELRKNQDSGIRLLEFLANVAQTHGDNLELLVTGHSKGSALATALALFLSDTQRNDEIPVRRRYQWNPAHRSKIQCYAFAGPTPGNTAFANYFNRQLGRNYFRYSNKLDIVTLVWQAEKLRSISSVYGESVNSLPGLDLLFAEMAEEVETLDYCHPGENYPATDTPDGRAEQHVFEFSGPLEEGNSSYILQELHQHIQAYINFMGLDKVLELKDLVGLKSTSRSV